MSIAETFTILRPIFFTGIGIASAAGVFMAVYAFRKGLSQRESNALVLSQLRRVASKEGAFALTVCFFALFAYILVKAPPTY